MKLLLVILKLFFILETVLNSRLITRKEKKTLFELTSRQKVLNNDQMISSKNNNYFAKMQGDGNFVLYSTSASNGKGHDNPTWASGTNGRGTGPYRLDMQEDGNLVVYDSSNKALWASNTDGKGKGPYRTIMQDDGNLVVYDSANHPYWASNSMGKKFLL